MHSISRDVQLDGLDYSLIATVGTGGFHAFWVCGTCDHREYCQLHESDEQAFAAAQVMAMAHHRERHAPGTKPTTP